MRGKESFGWQWAGAVALVIIMMAGGRLGWLGGIKTGVEWVSRPVMMVTWQAERWGDGLTERLKFVRSGIARIADLERENAQLRVAAGRVADLTRENEELRKLLQLRPWLGRAEMMVGKVIGRVGQLVLVDQGKGAGVKEGMVGITSEGVVMGRVSWVGQGWSRVRLLTDPDSMVAVKIAETSGRVQGSGGEKLVVDEVASGELIQGETVVTAGTDGLFPADLVVGKVGRLLEGGAAVYQRAEVVPAVNYDSVKVLLLVGY